MTENVRIVLDSLPLGLYALDDQLRIVFWNQVMEELSGFKSVKMMGLSMNDFPFYASPSVDDLLDFKDCLQSSPEERVHHSIYIRTASGVVKQFYVQLRRVSGDGYDYLVGFSDISRAALCGMLEGEMSGIPSFQNMIGGSPVMKQLFDLIRKAGNSQASVLISGESGTGKELAAKAIHHSGGRKEGPFIAVHCGALPETLLEAELFGFAKGSFTGADHEKQGLFEAASGGTLFLDEIGEISPLIQMKLLRAIQERKITRIGEVRERSVDIRIIAATNRDLQEMVKDETFREDLFYRLHVFPLKMPSLRDRREDIPLLVSYFMEKLNQRTGKGFRFIEPTAMDVLIKYKFKGNIRELENALEYAFVIGQGDTIRVLDLPSELSSLYGLIVTESDPLPYNYGHNKINSVRPRNIITEAQLRSVLLSVNGNKSEAARRLGISRVALWKKIKKWELEDGDR